MSVGSAAQPPQRLCPRCSTITRTVDASCPYCGTSYRRRGPWAAIAVAVVLGVAAVLAGIAVMLVALGDAVERELTDQVERVERDVDRNVDDLEQRVRRELDARLPPLTTPGG